MLTRREFIKWLTAVGATSAILKLTGCTPAQSVTPIPSRIKPTAILPPKTTIAPTAVSTVEATQPPAATATATPLPPYLSVAHGDDPATITQRAINALGGMERFVQPGQNVLIKPNICVAYHPPEYAATTNPQVVAALVTMCLAAGASNVSVMDHPFGGTAEQAYKISEIADAVAAAGGQMVLMGSLKFRDTSIPDGVNIKQWQIYQDALKADVIIDVPIAKHHSLAKLTLAMKNLMGLTENRSALHANLGERLTDLATLFKPKLIVIDAYRMLMANGPTGGDLNDVKLSKTVIASHDIVAADAYATTLFGLKPESISYIKAAAARGLGTLDLSSIKIEEINA